jgi:hypothetical protein
MRCVLSKSSFLTFQNLVRFRKTCLRQVAAKAANGSISLLASERDSALLIAAR